MTLSDRRKRKKDFCQCCSAELILIRDLRLESGMTNELRVIMIMMGLVQDMMMVIVWLLGRW